jgi:hypothetical protein
MAHKLTKELRKGLTAVAECFPATTENFREVVLGQQLLDENTIKLPNGKPVEAKQLYQRDGQRPVNHGRRLCKAYEGAGRAGVLDYCRPHIEPENFAAFSAKLSELVPL